MAPLHGLFDEEINQVLFEGNSCVKKVILNRPRKLNSLTYDMVSQMLEKFKAYEIDSRVQLVLLKGNGRAFCAGTDIVRVAADDWSFQVSWCKKGLTLQYLIITYKKPLVAFIDGIVMGGGAGLSLYARFKIVTENTVFAMPEAAIGHCPDVGASHFLSRLPGYFGEYLGLTGARLDGAGMVAFGLATHFVYSKDLHLLENALEKVASSDTAVISQILSKFAHQTNYIAYHNELKVVNECFSRETVEDILLALEKQMDNRKEKWIGNALISMKSASPTMLGLWLVFKEDS